MLINSSMEEVEFKENDKVCKEDIALIEELMKELCVPKNEKGFERPGSLRDYSSYLSRCNQKFEGLYSLIESLTYLEESSDRFKRTCLVYAIILSGEHYSSNLWTTDISRKFSTLIAEKCLSVVGFTSVSDALLSCNGFLFVNVLKVLRPKLLKDSWKEYAAAVSCYAWVLQQVESPHLAEHLNFALPTALILVDDFISENIVLGLKCLEHIINNVGRTHLSMHAHDDVILKALERIASSKEENIIEPIISVTMVLLKKKYPQVVYAELVMNDFDPIIEQILHSMMGEQKLKIRAAYSKMLPLIVKTRGLGILLHSNVLLKVIDDFVLESTSTVEGLGVLQCFIEVCWPRVPHYFDHIFLLICKVYLGLEHKRYPDNCLEKLQSILSILKKLCPEKMEERKSNILKQGSLTSLHAFLS